MNKKKSKNSSKRTSELKTVGQLLANHIDSILEDCNKNIIPITQEKKELLEQVSNLENQDLQNQNEENKPNDNLPINIPKPINNTNNTNNKKKLPPIKKRGKKSQSFMTDVGIIKDSKYKKNDDDNSHIIKNINTQIDAMLNNIDEVGEDEEIKKKIQNKELDKKNSVDFKTLINEIDDYKNQVHEEFDEVKYLIELGDRTHKIIDRHKNVMTNIFKGAGLQPKRNFDTYEDDDIKIKENNKKDFKDFKKRVLKNKYNENDDNDNYDNDDFDEPKYVNGYYYRRAKKDGDDLNEVFNKLKKINKIKDNINNIQDDFLGYHANLKLKIKEKK
jgi:hypothetical protein